jgi:hypothetical protein
MGANKKRSQMLNFCCEMQTEESSRRLLYSSGVIFFHRIEPILTRGGRWAQNARSLEFEQILMAMMTGLLMISGRQGAWPWWQSMGRATRSLVDLRGCFENFKIEQSN